MGIGMLGLSGPQTSFDAGAIENSAGDFFDGDFGCVDQGNAVTLEQRLGRTHFERHLRGEE